MSIKSLDKLLRNMRIRMKEGEKERLYGDIKRDFALIGSVERSECTHFDAMLEDARTRKEIKEYIKHWLKIVRTWSKKIDKEEKNKEKMEIYA